jgi:hypothetical protein
MTAQRQQRALEARVEAREGRRRGLQRWDVVAPNPLCTRSREENPRDGRQAH